MRRRFQRSPFCERPSSYGNSESGAGLAPVAFHQGTANTGVAVSVDSVGEPRAGNADPEV